MGQEKSIKLRTVLTTAYTLTSSMAQVGNLALTITKSGFYDLKAQGIFRAYASADDGYFSLAVNGNNIYGGLTGCRADAGAQKFSTTLCEDNVLLKRGDVVSLRGYYGTAGGTFDVSAGFAEAFISASKRS